MAQSLSAGRKHVAPLWSAEALVLSPLSCCRFTRNTSIMPARTSSRQTRSDHTPHICATGSPTALAAEPMPLGSARQAAGELPAQGKFSSRARWPRWKKIVTGLSSFPNPGGGGRTCGTGRRLAEGAERTSCCCETIGTLREGDRGMQSCRPQRGRKWLSASCATRTGVYDATAGGCRRGRSAIRTDGIVINWSSTCDSKERCRSSARFFFPFGVYAMSGCREGAQRGQCRAMSVRKILQVRAPVEKGRRSPIADAWEQRRVISGAR